MFGSSIKSAVSGMSHLQYDKRIMQHQQGCICSTSRRLCSIKFTYQRTSFAVGRQGVWFEKKVCSIRNVTSAIL